MAARAPSNRARINPSLFLSRISFTYLLDYFHVILALFFKIMVDISKRWFHLGGQFGRDISLKLSFQVWFVAEMGRAMISFRLLIQHFIVVNYLKSSTSMISCMRCSGLLLRTLQIVLMRGDLAEQECHQDPTL